MSRPSHETENVDYNDQNILFSITAEIVLTHYDQEIILRFRALESGEQLSGEIVVPVANLLRAREGLIDIVLENLRANLDSGSRTQFESWPKFQVPLRVNISSAIVKRA